MKRKLELPDPGGAAKVPRLELEQKTATSRRENFKRVITLLDELNGLLNADSLKDVKSGGKSIGQLLDELRHSAKTCQDDVHSLRDLHISVEQLQQEHDAFERVFEHRRGVLVRHKVIPDGHHTWLQPAADTFVPGPKYLELGFKENFPTLYTFLQAVWDLQKVGTSRRQLMVKLMAQKDDYGKEAEKLVQHCGLVTKVQTLKARIAGCDNEMRKFALRLQNLIMEPAALEDETVAATVDVNYALLFAKNLQMMGAARSANVEPPLILPPRPELQAVAHSLLRKSTDELTDPKEDTSKRMSIDGSPAPGPGQLPQDEIILSSEDEDSDDPFGNI